MSAPENPVSLLEQLKQKYGVDESDPLHGPSIIVPNRDYKPEWTRLLRQAGFKVYCGDKTGTIKLTLWDAQIGSVSVGDAVQIRDAQAFAFRGEKQLRIGRKGTLSVEQKNAITA